MKKSILKLTPCMALVAMTSPISANAMMRSASKIINSGSKFISSNKAITSNGGILSNGSKLTYVSSVGSSPASVLSKLRSETQKGNTVLLTSRHSAGVPIHPDNTQNEFWRPYKSRFTLNH